MTDNNLDSDDRQSPNSSPDSVQPQMTMHPITYSGMPMHMYPFAPGVGMPNQAPRTKRRQVKNACTNCQKACKKCDDARPCLRCVKYGISEECVDSQRKERQKGIKRGPYKKRDGKNRAAGSVDQPLDPNGQQSMVIPPAVAATSATPQMSYVAGYPPFYSQYPGGHIPKAGDAPVFVPQLFYAPMPPPPMPGHSGQDGEPVGYPTQYYPVYPAPYPPQAYATPYMMPAPPRHDGQMPMPPPPPPPHPHHYAPYAQMFPKPPSRGPDAGGQMMEGRRDSRVENGNGRLSEGVHGHHGKSG